MTWWHRLWRRRQMEEQFEKELRSHLDEHTTQLIALGLDREEARRQVKLTLGGPEQVKEKCRDVRGTRWLEDLLHDFRYALRALRQRPGFAAVALLTLALGIGATTVMYSVIYGVLIRPLPYLEPDRLVILHEHTEKQGESAFAYLNFLDCKGMSRSLASLAAWRYGRGTVSEHGEAEVISGRQISSELFFVLGINPSLGRAFLPEEDRPGAAPVIILSYNLWQRRYGGSSEVIGMSLVFNGKPYMIVGITPAGLRLPGDPVGEIDAFTPLGQDTEQVMQNRRAHPGIHVFGRLRAGVTLVEAQTELALIGGRLAGQYPESNAGRSFVAEALRPDVGDVRSTLGLLMGAVSLVLLIACVNIASLLLARAISRERELTLRVVLGASRGRLIRQCLTESSVLGLSGGILGVLLACISIRPFVKFWPGRLPRAEEVQLDWHVLLFALAISLLSGLLFGLAPILRVPAHELEQTLRAGSRTVIGRSHRLHRGFVISEIALAVVLLVSTGLLGRTILRLSSIDPGVNIRNVLTTQVSLSPSTLANPGHILAAWQDILDSTRRVPGVQSVALADIIPLRRGHNQLGYWTTPATPPPDQMSIALASCVTPDHLMVMGIPLLQGRFFNEQDRMGNEPVVVIDEILAQHAFGGLEPVGRRLWIEGIGSTQVVGVVGHVRHWGLANDDQAQVRDQIYYPFAQVPEPLLRFLSSYMTLEIRTIIAPLNVVEPLRREVGGANGDRALYQIRTLEQIVSDTLTQQRFLLVLLSIFAGLALLLACIGIYGVLAYFISLRVPEIGVRMALGASARDVIWLVLRQSLVMIIFGIGFGIAAALAAGHLLRHMVPGVQPTEPLIFAIMVSVLIVAALFASFVPARRASRIAPMSTLRQE